MNDSELQKLIENTVLKLGLRNKQYTLDKIIEILPMEDWESIKGNSLEKRQLFRGWDQKNKRILRNGNGIKWFATKIFMFNFVDNQKCQKPGCTEPLIFDNMHLDHIDQNHKNQNEDYFKFKILNLRCAHENCHMGSIHKKTNWDLTDVRIQAESNIKSTQNSKEVAMRISEAERIVKGIKKIAETYDVSSFETPITDIRELLEPEKIDKSLVATIVSMLTNVPFLKREKKNDFRMTKYFSFLIENDDRIRAYKTAWDKSSRPVSGINLSLQEKRNEVVASERLRHPEMQKFLKSIGVDVRDMEEIVRPFQELKEKNRAIKRAKNQSPSIAQNEVKAEVEIAQNEVKAEVEIAQNEVEAEAETEVEIAQNEVEAEAEAEAEAEVEITQNEVEAIPMLEQALLAAKNVGCHAAQIDLINGKVEIKF